MNRCPEALWDELARADDTATFFQTRAWHELAAAHFQAESRPLLFEFPDGPACLPLLRDRRWGRWRWFSPFGTYTALLCPRVLAPHERAAVERTLSGLNLHLASSPFTRNPVAVGRAMPARVQVLDLSGVDPEDVTRGWEKGQRRWSRVAAREGLTVRRARDASDWKAYYELYRLSLERWGDRATVAYPAALFDAIRDLGDGPRTLWLAEKGGAIGAGVLAFRHHRHMAVWHSAADAAFFASGATQILYRDMIGDAVREGYALLDFLGSAGLKGVETFKTHFGTRPREYASYLNRRGIVGALSGARAWLRGAWNR